MGPMLQGLQDLSAPMYGICQHHPGFEKPHLSNAGYLGVHDVYTWPPGIYRIVHGITHRSVTVYMECRLDAGETKDENALFDLGSLVGTYSSLFGIAIAVDQDRDTLAQLCAACVASQSLQRTAVVPLPIMDIPSVSAMFAARDYVAPFPPSPGLSCPR